MESWQDGNALESGGRDFAKWAREAHGMRLVDEVLPLQEEERVHTDGVIRLFIRLSIARDGWAGNRGSVDALTAEVATAFGLGQHERGRLDWVREVVRRHLYTADWAEPWEWDGLAQELDRVLRQWFHRVDVRQSRVLPPRSPAGGQSG